jgi:hypothetical protein
LSAISSIRSGIILESLTNVFLLKASVMLDDFPRVSYSSSGHRR